MMEPKIRFKGFEGEWKTAMIGEFCSVSIGEFVIKTKQNDNAPYPVYNGGSSYTGFYECYNQEGPKVIVSARGANAGFVNYCENNFWAGNSCYSIATKDNRNLKFLYHCLKKNQSNYLNNQQAANIPSISKKDIQETILVLPKSSEQKAIASYFTSLDSQISAATSRLASLKQMKAASLQAMFPQEGETVPKIRFKGFEGEWKKVKLSEILTERHENSTITDSLPQLSFTIADGVIRPEDRKSNKRDFLIKDIDNKRYLVTKVGDIIYNPANVVYGAIHRNSLMNGVVSPIYKIFTTMQDSNFIECAVRRPSFITKLAMCTEGTVTKLKTLKPEAFLNMEVCITPSLEEQKLIGNYFTSLDRQISLQSQRLEKLKQIKSACLDKMFV